MRPLPGPRINGAAVYGTHKIDPCEIAGGRTTRSDGKTYAGNIVACASGVPGVAHPIYVCDTCGKQFDSPESSNEIHRDSSLNLPGFKSKPPAINDPIYLADGSKFGRVLASIREITPGAVGGYDNVWEVISDGKTSKLLTFIRWERITVGGAQYRYVYAVCDRVTGTLLDPRGNV